MGRLIEFPCRDHYYDYYEDWQYEDYCDEDEVNDEEFNDMNQGCEVLVKDGLIKGFVRKCLMFILMRL